MKFVHYRTKGIPGRYPPGPFTVDSIRELLRDPYPIGLIAQYPTSPLDMSDEDSEPLRSESSQPQITNQRTPLRLIQGQHVAIISPALWQSNQQLRQQRGHSPSSANHVRRQYMLTGIGRCWECFAERGEDSPLYGTTGSGNGTRMYVCSWMKKLYKATSKKVPLEDANLPRAQPVAQPACRHAATRRAQPLEAAVNQLIGRLRIPSAWYDAILAYVVSNDGQIEFERRTYNLRQELDHTQRLYQLGQITEAELIQRAQAIQGRLQTLRPAAQPGAQQAAPHIQSFVELWPRLTAGEQRNLLDAMFAGLYFDAENRLRRIVTHSPFTRLLDLDTVTELD